MFAAFTQSVNKGVAMTRHFNHKGSFYCCTLLIMLSFLLVCPGICQAVTFLLHFPDPIERESLLEKVEKLERSNPKEGWDLYSDIRLGEALYHLALSEENPEKRLEQLQRSKAVLQNACEQAEKEWSYKTTPPKDTLIKVQLELAAMGPENKRASTVKALYNEFMRLPSSQWEMFHHSVKHEVEWVETLFSASRFSAAPGALIREMQRYIPQKPDPRADNATVVLSMGYALLYCAIAQNERPEIGEIFSREEKKELLQRAQNFFHVFMEDKNSNPALEEWGHSLLGAALTQTALGVFVSDPETPEQNRMFREAAWRFAAIPENTTNLYYDRRYPLPFRFADIILQGQNIDAPWFLACKAFINLQKSLVFSGQKEWRRNTEELWAKAVEKAPNEGELWLLWGHSTYKLRRSYGEKPKEPELTRFTRAACLLPDTFAAWLLWDEAIPSSDDRPREAARNYLLEAFPQCPAFSAFGLARLQSGKGRPHPNEIKDIDTLFSLADALPHIPEADLLINGYRGRALADANSYPEYNRELLEKSLELLLKTRVIWNGLRVKAGKYHPQYETSQPAAPMNVYWLKEGYFSLIRDFAWRQSTFIVVENLLKHTSMDLDNDFLETARSTLPDLAYRETPPPLETDTDLADLLSREASDRSVRNNKEKLLDKALEIYANAARQRPDSNIVAGRWAQALFRKSELANKNETRIALLQESRNKLVSALELTPNSRGHHLLMAEIQLRLCALMPSEQGKPLLRDAEEHFLLGTGLAPNSKPMFQAWAAALRKSAEEPQNPGNEILRQEAAAMDELLFSETK